MEKKLKKFVITGGAGTCGDRIVSEIFDSNAEAQVVSIDNDEGKLFFQSQLYANNNRYRSALVDIRDESLLESVFHEADSVIHCAAYKNVPVCENMPSSCISVNITGTESVIKAAVKNDVKKVIFTSSDKAVNPTNVMGATKYIGEKLIVGANGFAGNSSNTIFAATRFGNVVGSTGSVFPVFVNQLMRGRKMTITHQDMSRFMMSQKAAAKLVLESEERAIGGEIFITKMPVVNLGLFARAIFSLCKETGIIDTTASFEDCHEYIGTRPGEKMYEELMSEEERPRSKELDSFFALLPNHNTFHDAVYNEYSQFSEAERTYNSHLEEYISYEETYSFLKSVISDDNLDLKSHI